MENEDIFKVSIICLTYNHKPYIEQCLKGLVNQKAPFRYEIIIHDDCSRDGTREIIQKWQARYPDLVFPIYENSRQYTTLNDFCKAKVFPAIRGEYVAWCDGDDYWTDALKLARQAEVLDKRNDVSICFHPVYLQRGDVCGPATFPSRAKRFFRRKLSLAHLLKWNFIQSNSLMYRWRFHKDSLDLLPDSILPQDWFLHLLHAEIGKIVFLPQAMGVYRQHAQSVWHGNMREREWFRNNLKHHYKFFREVENHFNVSCRLPKDRLAYSALLHAQLSMDKKWEAEILDEYFPEGAPARPRMADLPYFILRESKFDIWELGRHISFIRRLDAIQGMYDGGNR